MAGHYQDCHLFVFWKQLQHSAFALVQERWFCDIRHNEVRDITSQLLAEVCKDVRTEPSLLELGGEVLNKQANITNEARLDVSATGFWIPGHGYF